MKKVRDDIEGLKTQIIDITLMALSIVFTLTLVFVIISESKTGFHLTTLIESIIIVALCLITFFRYKFSYKTKGLLILLLLVIIFTFETVHWGLLASSELYIILLLVLLIRFLPLRQTIFAFVIFIFGFVAIGYLFHLKILTLPEGYAATGYSKKMLPWIISAVHITIITLVILIVLSKFNELYKKTEAFTKSEKKYREMTEFLPQVVYESDLNGYVTYVNKKGQDFFGFTSEDFQKGIPVLSLIDPADHDKIKENIANIYKSGHQRGNEYTIVKKDGTCLPVEIYSNPIIKDQKPIGLRGIIVDITDRKNLERELEKHQEHLEQLIKERTSDLAATNEELTATNDELYSQREELQATLERLHDTQKQLIESEKMASLGILAAGISHEINNPLNFIQGGITGIDNYFKEYLADHLEKVEFLIHGVNEGVKRASEIVASLNHFSRKTDSQNEACNIHAIIDNCLTMLQSQWIHRIDIKKNYTGKSCLISGNEGKLHQAMLNILSNACQAVVDTGVISITTAIERSDLIVTISDNGTGISPENMPKIFDPFFTTKEPGKGVGLGLSISYMIVKEHRGEIIYKSQIDLGTTAIIKLPLPKIMPL